MTAISRNELIQYLDAFLDSKPVKDYCPNGLQVEGTDTVSHIVCGVTASLELIEAAAERNADVLLVHHGIIWGSRPTPITRSFHKRVKALIEANINLVGYHLPLDRHMDVGNSATVAQRLNLNNLEPFCNHGGITVGAKGTITEALDLTTFGEKIASALDTQPILVSGGDHPIQRVGIVTGAADKDLPQGVDEGLDCYVTGEISEYVMHYAKEEGIHFIAAGHHATERYGVQALGKHLESRFGVSWEFIDFPNPA